MNYTTERALRALELLAFGPCSVPELAGAMQIHRRTAQRLLHKLVQQEYATATRRNYRAGPVYALSPRLIGLAAHAIRGLPLTAAADHLLADLHDQLGQPVFIATPSYRHVLVIHNHGTPPRRWDLLPAQTSAAGKMLLAHRPAWRHAISARTRAITPAAQRTSAQIERDAEHILNQGYATETAPEHGRGCSALAVAIPSDDGQLPIVAL